MVQVQNKGDNMFSLLKDKAKIATLESQVEELKLLLCGAYEAVEYHTCHDTCFDKKWVNRWLNKAIKEDIQPFSYP